MKENKPKIILFALLGLAFVVLIVILLIYPKQNIGKNLTIEKVVFNRLDTTGNPVEIISFEIKKNHNPLNIPVKPVFVKGDILLILMKNIGSFIKGTDSLNIMELDVEIKGPDSKVIFNGQNLLGERGHVNLMNNIAAEPYTTYHIPSDAKPGKYRYLIRVSDLVSHKELVIKGMFLVKK